MNAKSHLATCKDEGSQSAPQFVQTKLAVGAVNDPMEHEADAVADKVMRMPAPAIQRKCPHCEEEERVQRMPSVSFIQKKGAEGSHTAPDSVTSGIQATAGGGSSLPGETRSFMESRFGADFSGVRIHTGDYAAQMSNELSARAFTVGNDIYFNQGEYQPDSFAGNHLLAHELTHTIQQKGITDQTQRMIQRTEIAQVLGEFFSILSSETLWNMNESDQYTGIVRQWQPVIDELNIIKADIAANCAAWSASHRTDTSWRPGMNEPMINDPHSVRHWVSSPPGTDPDTCRDAFILYNLSRVQTNNLYTCSIGSFGLAVTVDSIDCTTGTADIQVWMYNIMSRRSFGRFASYFPWAGMRNQYMWWNWDETINWTPTGAVTTRPERPRSGSRW